MNKMGGGWSKNCELSAESMAARMFFTPALIALSSIVLRLVSRAISRARLVFPTPGGPQRIMDGISFFSIDWRRAAPGAIR